MSAVEPASGTYRGVSRAPKPDGAGAKEAAASRSDRAGAASAPRDRRQTTAGLDEEKGAAAEGLPTEPTSQPRATSSPPAATPDGGRKTERPVRVKGHKARQYTCPSCEFVQSVNDYRCPRCGIVFDLFKEKARERAGRPVRHSRTATLWRLLTRGGWWKVFAAIFVILALFVFALTQIREHVRHRRIGALPQDFVHDGSTVAAALSVSNREDAPFCPQARIPNIDVISTLPASPRRVVSSGVARRAQPGRRLVRP